MSKELDIQIAVEASPPDVEIGIQHDSEEIEIGLEKRAIVYERDYEKLENLPQINSVQLIGNKTGEDLELQDKLELITRAEIRDIINGLQ